MESRVRPNDRAQERVESTAAVLPEAVGSLIQEVKDLDELSRLFGPADRNRDGNLTKGELQKIKTEDPEEAAAIAYALKNFDELAKVDGPNKTISRQDIHGRGVDVTIDALLSLAKMPDGLPELDSGDLYVLGSKIPDDADEAGVFVFELNRKLKEAGITDKYFEMERDVDIHASIGGGTDNILYLKNTNGNETEIVAKQSATRMRC